MDETLLAEVDSLVKRRVFPNRSRAIQAAVEEKLQRFRRTRLAAELVKLDVEEESALAEEGMGLESETWPQY
jgi:metal-responsive CopG/Arc/MetJ family transcriptional regulator